jgi:hypothetical protein
MCLNGNNRKFRIVKNLSAAVPVQNGLKRENASSSLLIDFASEWAMRKV